MGRGQGQRPRPRPRGLLLVSLLAVWISYGVALIQKSFPLKHLVRRSRCCNMMARREDPSSSIYPMKKIFDQSDSLNRDVSHAHGPTCTGLFLDLCLLYSTATRAADALLAQQQELKIEHYWFQDFIVNYHFPRANILLGPGIGEVSSSSLCNQLLFFLGENPLKQVCRPKDVAMIKLDSHWPMPHENDLCMYVGQPVQRIRLGVGHC